MIAPPFQSIATPGIYNENITTSSTMHDKYKIYGMANNENKNNSEYVKSTLEVNNNTLMPGNFNGPNPRCPIGIAYDSSNNYLYVSSKLSKSVYIMNVSSGTIVKSISLNISAYPILYDDFNKYIYVVTGSNFISVINTTTDQIIKNMGVGLDPISITYSNSSNFIFVVNSDSKNISIINGNTNEVVKSIKVNYTPVSVSYTYANNHVYVSGLTSLSSHYGWLTIINATTLNVITTMSVECANGPAVYDPSNNYTYAIGMLMGVVGVYGIKNPSFSFIPIDTPVRQIFYDPINQYVYISSIGNNNVYMLKNNEIKNNLMVGDCPTAFTYDPHNDHIFVDNSWSDNITVLNGTTNTIIKSIKVGTDPYSISYNPENRGVGFVNGTNCQYYLLNSSNRAIRSGNMNNPYSAYDPSNGYVYLPRTSCSYVSVREKSTNKLIKHITVENCPADVAYNPINNYLYVTHMNSDNITVINGTTNTIIKEIPVGTATDDIVYDSFNNYIYALELFCRHVVVINTTTNSVVKNISMQSIPDGIAYDPLNNYIYVGESSTANVSIIDSATNKIIENIGVGKSPNSIAYDPLNNYIYVANAVSGTISIIYTGTPATENYSLTFTATGIPPGTGWFVNLTYGPTYVNSGEIKNTSYTFPVLNGTYDYNIEVVNDEYLGSPASGRIVVHGSDISKSINFLKTYKVNFVESGLSSNITWYVTGNGISKHTASPENITFIVLNGTYTFTVTNISNYRIIKTHYKVVVNGHNVTVNLSYQKIGKPISISRIDLYSIVSGAVIALLTALYLIRRRKNR